MKKVKLPRKRKKALIKLIGRKDYKMLALVGEVLMEEGARHAERFYKLRLPKTKVERKQMFARGGNYHIERRY